MRRYWMVVLGLCIGLCAGIAAISLRPAAYTSEATLVAKSSLVSERNVPGQTPVDLVTFVPRATVAVLSRSELVTVIQSYELYPEKRNWMPMEDVIEQMRKNVSIQSGRNNTVAVAFTYSDRYKAQKVTSELTTKLIDFMRREELESMRGSTELLRDSAKIAAAKWTDLSQQTQAGVAGERLLLDRDLAKKQYVDLSARLAEQELLVEVKNRRLGSALEVVDPATLPEKPNISPYAIAALWTLGGLGLGVLAFFVSKIWWPRTEVAVPAV